jgi:hypothetical protein
MGLPGDDTSAVMNDAIESAKDHRVLVMYPPLVLTPDAAAFVEDLAARQGDASAVVAYVKTALGDVRVEVSVVEGSEPNG